MGESSIPGHCLVELPIEEAVRKVEGDEAAFNDTIARLRAEYLSFIKYGKARVGRGVTFRIALTVQRHGPPRT